MNWPQITYIILIVIGLVDHAIEDGKPKTGTYNFNLQILSTGLCVWILYCGGFF